MFILYFYPDCTSGEIRLIGISSALQGRVEVCSDGVWGTVCSRNWGAMDAAVACKQLGYSSSGSIMLLLEIKIVFIFS